MLLAEIQRSTPYTDGTTHVRPVRTAGFYVQDGRHAAGAGMRTTAGMQEVEPRRSSCRGAAISRLVALIPRPRINLTRFHGVFDIDIESCRQCGGAVKIIASIEDPAVIRKILAHLDKNATSAETGLLPDCRAPPRTSLFEENHHPSYRLQSSSGTRRLLECRNMPQMSVRSLASSQAVTTKDASCDVCTGPYF